MFLVGIFYVTGRCSKRSCVVVPLLSKTADKFGLIGLGDEAPPIEVGIEDFLGSSAIANVAADRDSLSTVQKQRVLRFGGTVDRRDSVCNRLVWADDGIVKLAYFPVGRGRVSEIGRLRYVELFSVRRVIDNVGGANAKILNLNIKIEVMPELKSRITFVFSVRHRARNVGDEQEWSVDIKRIFGDLDASAGNSFRVLHQYFLLATDVPKQPSEDHDQNCGKYSRYISKLSQTAFWRIRSSDVLEVTVVIVGYATTFCAGAVCGGLMDRRRYWVVGGVAVAAVSFNFACVLFAAWLAACVSYAA